MLDRREFLWLVGAGALTCRAAGDERERDAIKALLARPPAQQKKLATAVQAGLATLEDPWLARCRDLAAIGRRLVDDKPPAGWTPRPPTHEAPSPFHELPFALAHEYVWGHRLVRTVAHRPQLVAGGGKDAVKIPLGSPAEAVLAALRGLPPDADLALAAGMHALDRSTGADKFLLFLESWRNGNESFYQALDRTAGNQDSVFFYDAMLEEFARRFVPGTEPKRSLQKLHDALHEAFLVLRQYRAMREAAACATVLPPQVPLPGHLARYAEKNGGYSLRDDLAILAHGDAGDPGPALALVGETGAPLPDPLWSTHGTYAALAGFQKAFAARAAQLVARASQDAAVTTDGMLAAALAAREGASRKLQERAFALLAAG